jgi:hypothetical protein
VEIRFCEGTTSRPRHADEELLSKVLN